MDNVGVERVHGRPIKLFELSDWTWEAPEPSPMPPFTLIVAARAVEEDPRRIRRFAQHAIASGCRYVCAWGPGCAAVESEFDQVSIASSRFVMSTSHADEPLHDTLYFGLVNAIPEEVSNAAQSAVVLAIEGPFLEGVRRLVADQDELAWLWVKDE